MFTGIVAGMGQVEALSRLDSGCRLAISHDRVIDAPAEGDSICVDGVCLTALQPTETRFEADVSAETLRCTTLGRRSRGDRVNLEAAMGPGDLLGGHLLQGHVDGTARLEHSRMEGDSLILRVGAPPEVSRHCVLKGSIAVNGVSLTVSGLSSDWIEVTIIPHTLERTNLSLVAAGDEVNLEADLVSKYVEKHLRRLLDQRNLDSRSN